MLRNSLRAMLLGYLCVANGCVCVVSSSGDLRIFYTFDGLTCDQAGVDTIRLDLVGRRDGVTETHTVQCAAHPDHVTLYDLPHQTYDLTSEARSTDGLLLYASTSSTPVRVVAAAVNDYDVDIPSTSGSLTLLWTFSGSGDCGSVTDVRATVTDPFGMLYDDALYPCTYGGVAYDAVQTGVWSVTLRGLDASGAVLYQATDSSVDVHASVDNSYTIDLSPH